MAAAPSEVDAQRGDRALHETGGNEPERFADVFKDKVLLYLYEDAGKTKRTKMFKKDLNTYAKLCAAFDEDGTDIFGNGFDDHIVFGEPSDADDAASEE